MPATPAVLCQNRALKKTTPKIEYAGLPCAEVMEPVELSLLGTIMMCPKCDRQPGYRVDFNA